MPDVTPTEFLDQVAVELNERGWSQGTLVNDAGQVCALGAIDMARRYFYSQGRGRNTLAKYVAVHAIRTVLPQGHNIAGYIHDTDQIIAFNDNIAKSSEDIHLVLKQARELLDDTP